MRFRKVDYVWLIDADTVYASDGIQPIDSMSFSPAWEVEYDDLLDLLDCLGLPSGYPQSMGVGISGRNLKRTGDGNTSIRFWRSSAFAGVMRWEQVWAKMTRGGLCLRLDMRNDDGSIASAEEAYSGRYQVKWAVEGENA